ncbi:MAG: patatin-like phospholipase family protein [Parvibaculum sp.]|nr:patatin-like phospholipase family protein [Parvibaculum sp.]
MARKRPTPDPLPPHGGIKADEVPVLVLQGGGALGAYQAGVYQELSVEGIAPQWVAGISIGAINAAIIAGNPPETRVERLDDFWSGVSSNLLGSPPAIGGEILRAAFNETSAALVAWFGAPGFFEPRLPPAIFHAAGSPGALSFYDTAPLRATLTRLVDFDRINAKEMRLSIGAVNVRTGNFVYFDNTERKIGPEHVMASGALPPGFPPVEIDGEFYWDGGLVSNTPLQYVLDADAVDDMLVFQVDLFGARGPMPRTLGEAAEREKDIRYSSRTRLNTDVFKRQHAMQIAIHNLLKKLPPELQNDPDARRLAAEREKAAISIVHLIYRRGEYESQSKDYEFSGGSVMEHWKAGRNDVRRTLRQKAWRERRRPEYGVAVFDLTRDATD